MRIFLGKNILLSEILSLFFGVVLIFLLGTFISVSPSRASDSTIYRSVGPGNTSNLNINNRTVGISGTTATFSGGMENNVGVGDVLEYQITGTYYLAFISGRTSSSVYSVQSVSGGTPQAAPSETAVQVYRAYTSLANAEKGDENSALDDTVENFDDWAAGGGKDDDEAGKDLVSSSEQWNIALYSDATDTTSVTIDGWTTDSTHYIKIFTPKGDSQVGTSQRHDGTSGSGFILSPTDSADALYVKENYTLIDGLDISNWASSDTDSPYSGINLDYPNSNYSTIRNCLIHSRSGRATGIRSDNYISTYAYNNLIYDLTSSVASTGILRVKYAYNNTVYNVKLTGIVSESDCYLKNNIVQLSDTSYSGSIADSTAATNISDTSVSPGSGSKTLSTVSFVSTAGKDFHLNEGDTVANGAGTNLSADSYLAFSDDLDGDPRDSYWDIGADQTPPDTTDPSVPTNFELTDSTYLSVTLSWDASTDNSAVGSYRIYRGLTSGNLSLIGTVTSPTVTYTDSTAVYSTTYYYSVSAVDTSNNESSQTSPLEVVVPDLPPDPTPPTVSVTSPSDGATLIGTSNVVASASDNLWVVGVQFKIDGNNLGDEDLVAPYSVSWNTRLFSNGSHTVTAVARDATGNSATSSQVSVTTNNDFEAPSVPSGLSVTSSTTDTVNLSWSASTDNVGVAGYRIYRSDSGGEFSEAGTSASTSYANSGLVSDSAYSYKVSAYDAAGNESSLSLAVNTNTLAIVNSSHPRIWLTEDKMTDLRSKMAANDADWQELHTYCQDHVDDTGYSVPYSTTEWQSTWDGNPVPSGGSGSEYRMSGYHKQIVNFSLCYQILKNSSPSEADSYADHALAVMHGMVDSFSAGEESDGIAALRGGERVDISVNSTEASTLGMISASYKQGYNARFAGVGMALGYDWLYDKLSSEEKQKFYKVLYRWIDWYKGERSAYNNGILKNGIRYYEDQDGDCTGSNVCTNVATPQAQGFGYDSPANNHYSGFFEMDALASIATFGDTPDAQGYFDDFIDGQVEGFLKPALTSATRYKGGDSPEGWNYGSGWNRVLEGLYAIKTGTNLDVFTDFDWPKEFLRSYIHATAPNLKSMVGSGEWTGAYYRKPYTNFAYSPTFILSKIYPDDDISQLGQYFINNATFAFSPSLWERTIWKNSNIIPKNLTSEPNYYRATGTGLVTMRSTWDPSDSPIFASAQLGGWNSVEHENYDEGNILVQRGDDQLLVHENMKGWSVDHNTVVFNNENHHTGNDILSSPAIDRLENSSSHLFVSAELSNAWKRDGYADRAKLFRRNILYLRPGTFVVYDVTRSNSDLGNTKDWYTQYIADPEISGTTISATTGSSKVFVNSLYPTGNFTETNPDEGYYRVKFTPSVENEYEQFLHVIEATDSGSSQIPSVYISGTGARGALIQDPTENIVAMFTSDQGGADMTSLSYAVNTSSSSRHIIANLEPETNFSVSVGGTSIGTFLSSEAGVIEFTNSTSGLQSYSINDVPDTFPPSISSGSPSGTLVSGTTGTTLSVSTDENATCRYSLNAGASFASMTGNFSTTGENSHSKEISGLSDGLSYTYFVRCQDDHNNTNEEDYEVNFSIASGGGGNDDPGDDPDDNSGNDSQNSSSLSSYIKVKISSEISKIKNKIYSWKSRLKLKGFDSDLAGGGIVKLYKNGKLYKTISASASGSWSKWIKFKNNFSGWLKIKLYNSEGELIDSKKIKLKVDKEKPEFTRFPSRYSKIYLSSANLESRRLYFLAEDNDRIDYYKMYFNGRSYAKDSSGVGQTASFAIPENTPPGIHIFKVRAYDRAGNKVEKSTLVIVR